MASVAPPKPSYRTLAGTAYSSRRRAYCPTPSSKPIAMPAKRMPTYARWIVDGGRDLRRRLGGRLTMDGTPSASGAASCSATALAPARAAKSPASFSTTGCGAAASQSGSEVRQADRGRATRLVGARHGRLLVTPLSLQSRQGTPIRLPEGVPSAHLCPHNGRSDEWREVSRVRQIVEWLGSDFDG